MKNVTKLLFAITLIGMVPMVMPKSASGNKAAAADSIQSTPTAGLKLVVNKKGYEAKHFNTGSYDARTKRAVFKNVNSNVSSSDASKKFENVVVVKKGTKNTKELTAGKTLFGTANGYKYYGNPVS